MSRSTICPAAASTVAGSPVERMAAAAELRPTEAGAVDDPAAGTMARSPAPVIISVAITGSVPRKADNPALPVSPDEQVESTHAAFERGASLVARGGHVRTGLEDNIRISKERLASGNAELVALAAEAAAAGGRRVAAPAEARALLGLRPT